MLKLFDRKKISVSGPRRIIQKSEEKITKIKEFVNALSISGSNVINSNLSNDSELAHLIEISNEIMDEYLKASDLALELQQAATLILNYVERRLVNDSLGERADNSKTETRGSEPEADQVTEKNPPAPQC